MKIVLITIILCLSANIVSAQHEHKKSAIESPYKGEENREIKAISPQDLEGLKSGSGMVLGGLAKSAELNGYPGPKHVLDANKAGEFDLVEKQLNAIQALFESMQSEAIKIGLDYIDAEKAIEDAFLSGEVDEARLKEMLNESSVILGKLRYVHLKAHLSMMDLLNEKQIDLYNELRGYFSDNPCDNVPEGHDPEMWKLHNGCNR